MTIEAKPEYEVSTDVDRLNVAMIHEFLSRSYWAQDIPLSVVEKSIRHSLCFGVYCEGQQIAFARVITDFATFGYLADVFVVPAHRGRGVSRFFCAPFSIIRTCRVCAACCSPRTTHMVSTHSLASRHSRAPLIS